MFSFIFNRKSKSKSLLASSSAGSYPYPRVHTPLMLIPNKRNQQENIKEKENTVKRRPPLNKAIPTIPESKSSESIMSHVSRASATIQKATDVSLPPDSLVIANRIAVESLGRQAVSSKTAIPTSTSGASRNESREPPRSPLMSVAKSVKSKLTKLTRLGRSTERSSMKGSQSFSGVRQKPVVVKKMDENANRVIKSSSMDTNLPIISNMPSTSRVVVPQNPEPLCSPDENRPVGIRVEEAEKEMDDREVIGIVDYHVLMPPVNTVQSIEIEKTKEMATPININTKPMEETSYVIRTEKVVSMTMTVTEIEPEQEGNKENIKGLEQEVAVEHTVQSEPTEQEPEPTTEETSSYSIPRSVSGILEQRAAAKEASHTAIQEVPKPKRSRQEEARSPPRYILTAKTPEASRKHQTFMIGEGSPKENTEPQPKETEEPKKKRERSRNEESKSPPRYILTAKTPITNRKQQAFVIGEAEPKEEVTVTETVRVGAREMKPKRERPEEPYSPPRYILTAKTPEMSRKHTTFMIGEAETKLETDVADVDKPVKKIRSNPEEPCSPPKYILTAKTPLTQRKQLGFSIGEKLSEAVDAQVEKVAKEKRSTMKRSRSEEPSYTKFIMKVKTPAAIRRHHTFIVGERGKECSEQDLSMVQQRLEEFRQRSLSSQITGSQSFEYKSQAEEIKKPRGREEIIKKREKKLLRQRSTPETDRSSQTRFILVTKAKTPLPIRRCRTFMVGERAPSPDVPYIEEGEITEPIATVGPMAFKKRTKSEEPRKKEEKEEQSERFVMTVKTPLTMRKFHTFVVDEKPSPLPSSKSEQPITEDKKIKAADVSTINSSEIKREEMAKTSSLSQELEEKDIITRIIEDALHKKESDYEISKEPIRPTDMYVLTTTTPIAQRKNRNGDSEETRSPLGGRLFVMGKRQTPVPEEKGSQSDRAERRSVLSGELTSPEEEIPMDTMPSPLDNAPITSTIIHTFNTAPTFRAPSPPKYQPMTSSKSTSPVKSPSSYEPVSTSSDSRFVSTALSTQHEEKRKKNKKDKNQMKAPLATRSLRSASKILTPSFFRKTKNKSAPVKSMSFPSRPNMNLNIRDKQAPLAEFESSVVGDSPLVENMPLTFEKWSSSPRNRRRYSEKVAPFTETIVEESDGNGNPRCIVSPLMHRHEFEHSDLIDDEILDQPMLMGDNFSHSESSEVLARRATDYENERSTLVSIDRSYAEDHHGETPNRRRETNNNNNGTAAKEQTQSVASSRYFAAELKAKEELEDSLGELAAIKGALQHLQAFTNQEILQESKSQTEQVEEFDHLMKENDALRRELLEKDSLITQLKQQLAVMKQTQT